MEIERRQKKETTWVIKRRDQPGLFVLKSEEESETGSSYTIVMKQNDVELSFKMNREEFQNYISILNGFKDVVLISEPEDTLPESKGGSINSNTDAELKASPRLEPEPSNIHSSPEEKPKPPRPDGKSDSDSDLDPTEWDPF